jgi:hypothetical protein
MRESVDLKLFVNVTSIPAMITLATRDGFTSGQPSRTVRQRQLIFGHEELAAVRLHPLGVDAERYLLSLTTPTGAFGMYDELVSMKGRVSDLSNGRRDRFPTGRRTDPDSSVRQWNHFS